MFAYFALRGIYVHMQDMYVANVNFSSLERKQFELINEVSNDLQLDM